MKKLLTSIFFTGLSAAPFLALAQGGSGIVTEVPLPSNAPRTFEGFIGIFNTLINWFFTILLIVAIIYILLAAYNYLTAAGDDDKVKKAHKMLIYAVVGIAVALLAQGVRFVVAQLVRTPIQ